MELPGAAVEEPPASAAEQGVATEQAISAIIRHVSGRVARHIQHLQGGSQFGEFDPVTFTYGLVGKRKKLVAWRINRHISHLQKLTHAIDVIVVMMGNQDGKQRQLVLVQVVLHRYSIARIDYHCVAAMHQQPDVVVAKGPNWNDIHGKYHKRNRMA